MKHEDQYTSALNEIRDLSKVMNLAVDRATEEIERVEKRLADTEPGVVVWGPTLVEEIISHTDDTTGATEPVQRTAVLGFGRSKKKWGFVVREELRGKKKARDTEWAVKVVDEVCALRKADRELRLRALPHLLTIVEAVRTELQSRAERLLPALPQDPSTNDDAGGWQVVDEHDGRLIVESNA